MQRRNREIVIFSLSAIDLFCAGMGAVMVLMVLLMPYYRRPPIPPVPIEPEPVAVIVPEQPKPEPPKPKPPQPTPPEPVPEPGLQVRAIDVVFVMDATASMEDELDEVRSSLRSIVQVLRRLSDDVTVGFVAYIDWGVLWAFPPRSVARGGAGDGNLRLLLKGIAGIELDGGRDWPEDVCKGLERAITMRWPAAAGERRQVVVVIGDAETHPIDRDRSLAIVRKWIGASPNRSVHTVNTCVNVPAIRADFNAARRYFQDVARQGGGQYFEDEENLLGAILDILIIR